MNESHSFIKENGIYYTDEKLAKKMIKLLDIDYNSCFTIIEPAVGEGHILSIIVDQYLKENKTKDPEEVVSFLERNIVGFDIRKDAIESCKNKLDLIVKKYFQNRVRWNITVFDALERDKLKSMFGQFDYVISNPPYVSRHNIGKSKVKLLEKHSIFCSKYNYDLYYYFFEVGLDLWNKNGKMVFITPNGYIKARSAETMRRYLMNNRLIEKIIDYEDEMKFEDATTYTAITVISENNSILKVYNNQNKIIKRTKYETLINRNRYMIYSHNFLTMKSKNYYSLGDVFEIRNGIATLQDKVFVIKENEIIEEDDEFVTFEKNNRVYKIEAGGVKKGIRPSNLEEIIRIIFPYIESQEGHHPYIQDMQLEYNFPEEFNYLKIMLSEEYQRKYGIYFGRTQGLGSYAQEKIVIPKVASLNNKPFKLVGEGFLLSALSLSLNSNEYQVNIQEVLAFLNSIEINDYLRTISKNYSAGYKSISSPDLKNIKIPKEMILRLE